MQTNTKNLNPFSTFENRLKEVRARRRMTQLELSIVTQIRQTKLSYIENGFQMPNQDEKKKIADALEVPPIDIFPGRMTEPARLQKRLYTLREASIYLGRGLHGVRDLVWNGKLPVVKQDGGRKLFVDIKDLDSFIEKSKFTMDAK